MSLENLIVEYLQRATTEVFATMLGSELARGEASGEKTLPDPGDGVVTFIGVAGPWAGTGSISCSPAAACRVCSCLLQTEAASVDEEVLDAMAELTNMIIGGVKTDLEQHLGPLGLSIPTVVFGRNFKTKAAGGAAWTAVRFDWEGEAILVKFCLAPAERASRALPLPGQDCALEI